jgi:general nucleoside transport system permease protein
LERVLAMSTAVATASPMRAINARHAGWAGIALGIAAWFIALPPALVRTPVPSILIGLLAMTAGGWAIAGHERRLGWGAIAAGLIGGTGAVAATKSGTGNLEDVVTWSALIAATLRFATPLTLAALGGIVSERSGVINVGLEGMMLMGAFFGIFGADLLDSWFLGLLVGMAAGGLLALVHAFFAIQLRADQVVSGMALNFLALGITGYIFLDHYGDQGTPDNIPRVPDVSIPGVKDIGFVGDAIGKANLLTWLALIGVVLLAVYLFRTPSGLRLRSVGEHPRAAETVGISVPRTRYLAVTVSGMLAAMGGAYLSIAFVGSFNQGMTAGRGFIALAAVIFGNWRPGGALAAALLFGFSSALAQRLPAFSPSSAVLFQALPYVLTLIAVAGVIGRSRPPAAVGQPYVKE